MRLVLKACLFEVLLDAALHPLTDTPFVFSQNNGL
jgi:hypothetical protein